MSNSSAKDLLEQADQLIRRARVPDDLPVLTELVADPPPARASRRSAPTTNAADRYGGTFADESNGADERANVFGGEPGRREPSLGAFATQATSVGSVQRAAVASAFADARRESADGAFSREQFDQAVIAKLEQIQHSVYSQVMQQLELHATGEMKRKLREALEPALMQVSRDIAAQVAEETSLQVQHIVSNAVENEVARLREQILNKRKETRN